MPSYRDLLQAARESIEEVDARRAQELLGAENAPLLVDVREREEWEQGRIPGAVHVPRGNLESRIEGVAPERSRPVLLYCSVGNRSAFAAKTLSELGYEHAISLAGGYTDWQQSGLPTDLPRSLGPVRTTRYSRHLLIPEVGEEGQLKLLDSRILLIGAGGLGSPASLYLAAAGVGRLGIVDADVVDETNLQRQIAHSTDSLGEPKTDSARRRIEALNPDVEVVAVPRAPDLGEHRAHPRARLGRDRRRRRQLPDALPRERRVGLARDPGRARLDLPLRGPGHRLQARGRARVTAACSRSRRRRSSPRAAPRAACWACSQA